MHNSVGSESKRGNTKSGRWLPKSSPSFKVGRRGSNGEVLPTPSVPSADMSSVNPSRKAKVSGSLKVNGIPDWENPMAAKINPDTLPLLSPRKGPSKSNKTRRTPERTASTESKPKQISPIAYDNDDYHRSCPNIENMVIECDLSVSSSGDITYDESVAQDDAFMNSQRNYKLHPQTASNATADPRGQKSHVQSYMKSPPKPIRRQTSSARPSPPSAPHASHHFIPDDHRRPSLEQSPPARSVEDEEQRLIELAMERSLQDSSSYNGSAMSMSRKSATSERSYQSRASTGSYRGRPSSGVSLGGAGCHLSIAGSRSTPNRGSSSQHSSQGGPPGDAGPDFVWKRDGKKWLKIPVDHLSAEGLQAIEEENLNESFCLNQPRLHQDDRRTSGEAKLEEMERRMIEEAMHRSMSNFHNASPPTMHHRMQESFAASTNSILEMLEEDDCYSKDSRDIDPETAMARLRDLEREKAMLELAVQRSTTAGARNTSSDRRTAPDRRYSNRTSKSVESDGQCSNKSFDRSLSSYTFESAKQELSGAGCHLAMIARRPSRDEVEADESRRSTRGVSRNYSSESSQGQNLVWKRGPNNAWGRFPEDDNAVDPNLEDEDDLVAEALKRSLKEM